MGFAITATGHYLPPLVITNHDLEKIMDTSDEWIKKRTGISSRHMSQGENTSDMAGKAAAHILEKRNIPASEIDFIIVATMTPDATSPSTACLVQEKIGATKAFCFDLSAACSGFVYAMATASHLMESGAYQYGLVLGAETMSKVIDFEDRSTAVLFGDGAGGVLLERTEGRSCLLAEDLHSDGTKGMALTASQRLVTHPFLESSSSTSHFLTMDGRGIFDFVIKRVPETIETILAKGNIAKENLDYVIAHQANSRLLKTISKKVSIPLEKFASNIAETGNTSAASIPILFDQMVEKGQLKLGSGQHVLLTGFGGGLTWGSILVSI